jgi:signal peptidase I
VSPDNVVSSPGTRTFRAGWGWLLLSNLSRFYLVFLGTLAACGLVPMLFGLSGSVVQSGSMEPHISRGDVVLSRALPANARPPIGRVITFRAPVGSATSGFVLHRLVAANDNGSLVTRGDANANPDSTPLDRRNIISQARLLIPWIGLPSIWVATGAVLPLGLWLLLTLGALVIGALDRVLRRPPAEDPPEDSESPSGPDPESCEAAPVALPQGESIPARLTPRRASLTARIRVATGPAAVALVALLTAGALATAPLGQASAAFSATTSSAGNTWGTAHPATRLAFPTDPSDSAGGIAFGTQPVVVVQDAAGNTVTTSNAPVTLSITTPGGATLTCTANPMAASSGTATFSGCKVDKVGTYTLTATSGALTSAVSTSFTITPGSATKLGFTASPSSSNGGTVFGTQPSVTVQDAGGNTTTGTDSVTVAITAPLGAVLTCATNPKAAVAGVAIFAGCKVDKAGTYTLTATSGTLTSAVSASFTIATGSATKLGFTSSPTSTTANTAFSSQPVVAVQDAGGNTISATNSVTLTITTPAGAVLNCTANSKAAVAGVATFAGCSINKTGTYTLTAAAIGLTNGVSASFTIAAGSATHLVFTTSPSSSTSGSAFASQPVVAVQDAAGNTTAGTNAVTLTVTTPAGAILTCTANPTNAFAGLATFAGCSINKTGTYTLTATAIGLTSAVSTSFTISAGTATKLVFTTSPSNAARGVAFATQPVVTVQDAEGNVVTSSGISIDLSITSGGGATLTCTQNPTNDSLGVATFAGCSINTAATYTLTARASGGLTGISNSFIIS